MLLKLMNLSDAVPLVMAVMGNCLMTEKVCLSRFLHDLISKYGIKEWQSTGDESQIYCVHLPWNHSKDKTIFMRVWSTITDFYNWHFLNFYTWCPSYCTRWELDLLCLKSVCAKWWLVYAKRSCPHLMQYLIMSPKWMSPSQEMYFKKAVCLCLLSCGF